MAESGSSARIASLDQFRGYTVAGMLLVNFVGSYPIIQAEAPTLGHYHTYCSYADTIMPQFFFAVGFAYRLTILRRREKDGSVSAYWHMVKRCLGLILLGAVLYHLDGKYSTWAELGKLGWQGFLSTAFERNFFQTLVHIGVTSLWVLPFIASGPMVRVSFLLFSALLHVALSHPDVYAAVGVKFFGSWLDWHKSYYEWVWTRPGIDGGPLGFLTWTIPLLVGSLAYDAMVKHDRPPVYRLLFWGSVLMALGYGLACLNRIDPTPAVCFDPVTKKKATAVEPTATTDNWPAYLVEPPFVPPSRPVNVWTMSQRAGSVSYLTFGAGFSLAVYVLFILACDLLPLRIGLFRTFGQNALAAYIIHDLVAEAVKPFVPAGKADPITPLWYVAAAFGVYFGISYLFTRYLEKNGIFLRL